MSETNETNLIQQYCDGELSVTETAELEQRLEVDQALRDRIAFERTLRQRIAAAMTSDAPSAPAGLRERIQAALVDAEAPAASVESEAEAAAAPPATTSAAGPVAEGRPVLAFLRGPRRANLLAVAATLALVTCAVLYGIFGPRLDDQSHRPVGQLAEWAMWALEHHDNARTEGGCGFERGSPEDAQASISEWLMVDEIPLFDLEPVGYDFVGAGPCEPQGGHWPSCHVMFARSAADQPAAMVSVVMVPDQGQFSDGASSPSTFGQWFPVDNTREGRIPVLYTTDGVLVYFLTCCDPADLEPVSRAMSEVLQPSVP